MAVNWADIQRQAEEFVPKYIDAKDEDRDAKPFWKDLMLLFGVEARSIGAFEERVRVYGRPGVGKIDYFAPRKFLIEHKSRGESLDKAYKQALEYFDSLASEVRPRYIVVSDFARIRIHDLEKDESDRMVEFVLDDLPSRVRELAFFTDEEVQTYEPEEHIDVRAVRVVGKLHKALKLANYEPAHIPRLLTRLVFCFFSDDIGIWEKNALRRFIENNTKSDGVDIGEKLHNIFEVLDTPESKRQTGLLDELRTLPYVNGGIFSGPLRLLQGTREIRDMLLECMEFDWSQVSPAIFGSMFQSVMDEKERHDLGAHYTSEANIKKVINGLFLEEFHKELESAGTNKARLTELWERLAQMTLLDPACGCGNFLVISYRELRAIENEIIRRVYGREDKRSAAHVSTNLRLGLGSVDLDTMSKLSIERMYGIEIDAFAAEVAKLSLWLVDHKMNMELGRIFDTSYRKLPLREQPNIAQGNALRMDWEDVVPKEKITHILGNPPFNGAANKTEDQIEDMKLVFGGEGGKLDYVAAWYKRTIEYIGDLPISAAFVSTNSIAQGEQVALLWPLLWSKGFSIKFAHQTFRWTNEATGKAAVFCVIVGFSKENKLPQLFTYSNIAGEPERRVAKNINGYLVDGPNIVIDKRRAPLCNVPVMIRGSIPYDDGLLLLSSEEKDALISERPAVAPYIRRYGGAKEMLNNEWRYCLWLVDAPASVIREIPEISQRVNAVRIFRELSSTDSVKRAAKTPYLFGDIRQPTSDYLMFPRVSSERRNYLPIAYVDRQTILADSAYGIPNASLYLFGVLQSSMHMTWMRAIAGRLKSDYRYSNNIVYNNFPWPQDPTEELKKTIEKTAQNILDVRARYPTSTLAELYDRNAVKVDLLAAHKDLDKAVDSCYGVKGFNSESERLEFLFGQYQKLAVASESKSRNGKKVKVSR